MAISQMTRTRRLLLVFVVVVAVLAASPSVGAQQSDRDVLVYLRGELARLLAVIDAQLGTSPSPDPVPPVPEPSVPVVVYDNDGVIESGNSDAFILTAASAGRITLRGLVTTYSFGEEARQPALSPVSESTLVRERQEYVEKARRSGLRNLPDVTAGPSLSFDTRRPASGRIEDTVPFDSPGGRLIVAEARQRSTSHPLYIVMGGQPTAVADAYLLDPTIADKIVLLWLAARKNGEAISHDDYNWNIDRWATYIAIERLQVTLFIWDGDVAHVPRSRLTELPDTELRQVMLETEWSYSPGACSVPSIDVDTGGLTALLRPEYVVTTRRFRFDRWETHSWRPAYTRPVLVQDNAGRVTVAWTRDGAIATSEWWARTTDPAAWGTPAGRVPFGGVAWTVPGTIEAEHFDHGGNGRAYQDSSTFCFLYEFVPRLDGVVIDLPNPIRTIEHPRIFAHEGGYAVGTVRQSEWLRYSVQVPIAGAYTFEARLSSSGDNGTFHLYVDDVYISGFYIPNTGGPTAWRTVSRTGVALSAGSHVVKIQSGMTGTTGIVANFDRFAFQSTPSP